MALESSPPNTINVPVAQLQAMEADRARVQEMLAQRELDATAANIRATAASGAVDQLARSHRQEIEQERQRAATIAAKAELASALARQPLLPHAVDQLASILSKDITATPDGRGGFSILSKDYKDVSTFVTETLAQPTFSHFRSDLQPPAPPVNRPTQPATDLPEPKNYGEFVLAEAAKQRSAEAARAAAKPATLDMAQPFGIPQGRPAYGSPLFSRPR